MIIAETRPSSAIVTSVVSELRNKNVQRELKK